MNKNNGLEKYNEYIVKFGNDLKSIPKVFTYCGACGGYTRTLDISENDDSELHFTSCNICGALFNIDVPKKMPIFKELKEGIFIETYQSDRLDTVFCLHCGAALQNVLFVDSVTDMDDINPMFIIACQCCKSVYAIKEIFT